MSKKWTFLVWKNSIRWNIVRRHNMTNAFEYSNCLELSLEISEEVTIPHYYQWADDIDTLSYQIGVWYALFQQPAQHCRDVPAEHLYD